MPRRRLLRRAIHSRKRRLGELACVADREVRPGALGQALADQPAVAASKTWAMTVLRGCSLRLAPALVQRQAVLDAEVARLELQRPARRLQPLQQLGGASAERTRSRSERGRPRQAPAVAAVGHLEAAAVGGAGGQRQPHRQRARRVEVAGVGMVLVPLDGAAHSRRLARAGCPAAAAPARPPSSAAPSAAPAPLVTQPGLHRPGCRRAAPSTCQTLPGWACANSTAGNTWSNAALQLGEARSAGTTPRTTSQPCSSKKPRSSPCDMRSALSGVGVECHVVGRRGLRPSRRARRRAR